MTLLRKAAISIVKSAIRFAPPKSRIWLQALLGELSYVENDWDALRWALGSTRILLLSKEGHVMTMSEIPAAASALKSTMTRRTWVGGATVTTIAVAFVRMLSRVPDTWQRMGCIVLIMAMLFMLVQLLGARPRTLRAGDMLTQIAHYNSELTREWNFHRGPSFWSRLLIILPGFLLLAIGRTLSNPASLTSNAARVTLFLSFAALAIPNNWRHADRCAAQLRALEQLHPNR